MSADFTRGTTGEDEYLLDSASMMEGGAAGDDAPDSAPAAPGHASGTQLRRRFVTPESIAELEATQKTSLLQRLLRRK